MIPIWCKIIIVFTPFLSHSVLEVPFEFKPSWVNSLYKVTLLDGTFSVRHIILELPLIYEPVFVNESPIDLPFIPDPPTLIDTLNIYNRIAIFVNLFGLFDKHTPAMLDASVFFYFSIVTSIDNIEGICFQLPVIIIHLDELFLMLLVSKFIRI